MLKRQMKFLRQDEENRFTPNIEDVDAASPYHLLISSDDDHDDEKIEIDQTQALGKQFKATITRCDLSARLFLCYGIVQI